MTRAPLPISASVDVDATPQAVWAVVSDVRRMPQWSPELRRLVVLGRGPVGVGTTLLGLNRRGWVAWPTSSRVTRFEPEAAIAWRTRESGATWTYELTPLERDGGAARTRLTGRRDLAAYTLGSRLMGPVIGGAAGHDQELADGIATTLRRIKETVEALQPA